MSTTSDYAKDIKKIRKGEIRVIGTYVNAHTKLEHECVKCKHVWMARPCNVKHRGSGCPKCSGKYKPSTKEHQKEIDEVFGKGKLKLLDKYVSRKALHRYKCLSCLTVTRRTAYDTMSLSHPCYECALPNIRKQARQKSLLKKSEFLSRLSEFKNIKYISGYTGISESATFKCLLCKSNWSALCHNVLKYGYGCPDCSRTRNNFAFNKKTYRLGKVVVDVQGYEPQALDYLIRRKKLPPSSIEVSSTGKVPVILYILEGKPKKYYPDIFIPALNRIVEVKSRWTFGYGHELWFKQNSLKAKACIENGYSFTMLVMENNVRLKLPDNWYDLSWDEVRKFL